MPTYRQSHTRGCRSTALLRRRLWRILLLATIAWILPAGNLEAREEQTRSSPFALPFEQWVAGAETRQIAWDVDIAGPELSIRQYFTVSVTARLSNKELLKRGNRHDLLMVAMMADAAGRWFDDRGFVHARMDEPLPERSHLNLTVRVVVLPGRYTLGLVLYDNLTGERNVLRRPIRVSPIKDDPLENSYGRFPPVKFLPSDEELRREAERDLRLRLTVETRRPLDVEVLVNFSLSDQFSNSPQLHQKNVEVMLAALEVLSQIDIRNGSLRITGLDLTRRRVIFEQESSRAPDWSRVKAALRKNVPHVISSHALGGRKENAAFLGNILADRLGTPGTRKVFGGSGEALGSAEDPMRVFIIVSSGMVFSRGTDLRPLTLDGDCGCRAFHLQFRISRNNIWDYLRKIIKPLSPSRYELETPMEFRKALGKVLEELSDL